jgi:hypothetical protein
MAMAICVNTDCSNGALKIHGAKPIATAPTPSQNQGLGTASGLAMLGVDGVMLQPSRVPIQPWGRSINISTKNKYGKMGAACDKVNAIQGAWLASA